MLVSHERFKLPFVDFLKIKIRSYYLYSQHVILQYQKLRVNKHYLIRFECVQI